MKLKEVRQSKDITADSLAKQLGVDTPMMSRFENYKCLPIPSMLEKLCKILNCSVSDIYKDNEIYIKRDNQAKRKTEDLTSYRLTVNLPKDAKEFLHKALKKCGYKDITYWIYRCYERLKSQYEIILKAEKKTSQTPGSN